jgi:hypothetical protein
LLWDFSKEEEEELQSFYTVFELYGLIDLENASEG